MEARERIAKFLNNSFTICAWGGIAVLDAGGQDRHLLARRVREIGAESHAADRHHSGSVHAASAASSSQAVRAACTEPDSPRIHPSILDAGVPILGICYGHQLLAASMPGGVVKPSYSREYGLAQLKLQSRTAGGPAVNGISAGVPETSTVWVSHGDSVQTLPDGFERLAATDECAVAAMASPTLRMFGVQFIPKSPTPSTASSCSGTSWRESAGATHAGSPRQAKRSTP